MRVPDLRESVPVPPEVKQAAEIGELVMFVGAGVSMRVNLPSWRGFAMSVLKYLASKELLNYNEIQTLKFLEPRKILSIAKLIERDHHENLDFAQYFRDADSESEIYDKLNSIGCTFVTTNYDLCLQPTVSGSGPGNASTTQQQGERITSCDDLFPSLLDELGNVIHLHGAITKPEKMVISTLEYLSHYDSENVQKFLEYLFKRKTVVFIGYGLEETELLEHILRRGSVVGSSKERKLFALQGFYSSQTPIYERLYRYYGNSFELKLLGFLKDYKDYCCLDEIVTKWADTIIVKPTPLSHDADVIDRVLGK